MTLPPLTIIPAGAGSGKTYAIQDQLGTWVTEGKVAPERIVAVTFTEAAAAELRTRIGSRLASLGRIEEAMRLDEAYISTIHGFGLRILTEFAFECGVSPKPRLLNEDEQNALIRLALARTDKADNIISNLSAYGYTYDFNSGKGAEDVFRDDLLGVIGLLRSVGWQSYSDDYAAQATEWITRRYGPTQNGARLTDALRQRVDALLSAYPESLARDYGDTKAAYNDLQTNFISLHRALEGAAIDSDWALWKKLRSLRLSNRRTKLPDEYDALASEVIRAADELPSHPGPLAHAHSHIEALLSAGQEVLVHYADAKREAGLVDYNDMIAMAGHLLRNRPDVLETLVNRVDCLVVDEFQDTNPLQFDLLWQLKEAGVPTMVVGDLKQAIMGFQGADPRLFEALERHNQEICDPLTRNWRSQPPLMEFINTLGPGLFGDEYESLAPQSEQSLLTPCELVSFSEKAKKDFHAVRAVAVGERLRALLEDSAQKVVDRCSKELRKLRGGDIAVLCPTNPMVEKYAAVLRAQGLRVRLQADGWFSSRPVQIAWHALAYLANPADRHAALYLAVTELGSLSLQDALQQLMDTGRIEEPLLCKLDNLAGGVAERTVYALVADTLGALGLFDIIATWPDGEQARANLMRLLSEAGEFMDANREALAKGGYHGAGVQTLLSWLAAKAEEKDGDKQPDSRVVDEDAIALTTWHSAKGREWPVVAVCGLDRAVNARLPNVELGYSTFEDLSQLLERARVEYAPKFSAPEAEERFLGDLQGAQETEVKRLLYVAFTRAREKLLLEWPEYLAGKDSTTYWSILTNSCVLSLMEDSLKVGAAEFPCTVFEGKADLPGDLDLQGVVAESERPVTGRRAIQRREVTQRLTPDSRTPSQLVAEAEEKDRSALLVERYGDGLTIDSALPAVTLGTYLHRCFEVLAAKPEFSERIPLITGIQMEPGAIVAIAAAVGQFESWQKDYFSSQSVLREWPVLSTDEQNSVVSGIVDLIVQGRDGVWVIDHKSDEIEDPLQGFDKYRVQLQSYARSLAEEGENVLGLGINWIRRGEVVLMRN